MRFLFEQFDRDHDGKISFNDFHTPKQVTIATAFGGTGEGQQPAHALPPMCPPGPMGMFGMYPGMEFMLPPPSNFIPPHLRQGAGPMDPKLVR